MSCFYHTFKHPKGLKLEGWGDCKTCTPDEKNKDCRGYIAVNISIMEVHDENKNVP